MKTKPNPNPKTAATPQQPADPPAAPNHNSHLDSQSEGQERGNRLEAGLGSPIITHKFKLPQEFDGLSPEVMDYINDYLRENTYADTQRMLFTEYGIKISINKLFRYREKLDLALHLEISQDTTDAVEQLLNIYNGQPADIDQAGLETLKRRALQLAVSPKTKPSMLLNLMRIFTYAHRKSMDEHRKKMDGEKSAHRARMAAVAERRAKCEEDRVKLLERHQLHHEERNPTQFNNQEEITRIIDKEFGWGPGDESTSSVQSMASVPPPIPGLDLNHLPESSGATGPDHPNTVRVSPMS